MFQQQEDTNRCISHRHFESSSAFNRHFHIVIVQHSFHVLLVVIRNLQASSTDPTQVS